MPKQTELLNEIDRCWAMIRKLRVLSHAAADLVEYMGHGIYSLCIEQGRDDLRLAMDDMTTAIFMLHDMLFAFHADPSVCCNDDTPE